MVLRAAALWKAALAGLCLWTVTPALAADTEAAANYYVKSLPGQPDGPLLRMHAGHIEVVPEHHGKLFFWRYENRHLANRHRTVVWLNGGPGCSSEDGALMEIGPYRVKDSGSLEYNPGAWDEFANLLFVDNPVGTGFSSVDSDSYIHELTTMAEHFITFLEKYFAIFPQEETNDIYIAGESYAGQHIPYIAKAILDRNKDKSTVKPWNLKGLLIGNGWISPVDQGPSYLEYMYKNNLIEKGSQVANTLDGLQKICTDEIARVNDDDLRVQYDSCERVLQRILELTTDKETNQCFNMYDVRLKDSMPACGMNWPPDLAYITPYLQRADVKEALHVNEDHGPGWTECNGQVSINFHPEKSTPSIHLLPDILAQIPVILFSGDQDLICNHMGTETLIDNMSWNGGKGFEISPGTIAPRKDWVFEGEPAGFYQEARNLTYVLFYNSSHMVPFDVPRRTRDMLDRFMGVDIGSVGGKPIESLLDGNKGPSTSVGGHPNSTLAEEEEAKKLELERWSAYYRSGAVALVVVMILAIGFGWYVWQDRRRRAGYGPVGWMKGPRGMMHGSRPDLEATDFDEGELDELASHEDREDDHRYSLGGVSSDEDDEDGKDDGKKLNGHTNGSTK